MDSIFLEDLMKTSNQQMTFITFGHVIKKIVRFMIQRKEILLKKLSQEYI